MNSSSLFDLSGSSIVITGAGGHICSAFVSYFASLGCKVAVLDVRLHKAIAISDNVNSSFPNSCDAFECDVSSPSSVASTLDILLEKFGPFNVLINGAGTNSPSPFFDISFDDWNSVFNSQIHGTFLMCQTFGKFMVDNQGGSIINISSASAGPPLSKAFAYSASKAAIVNLSQNLAREWALSGVRVNCIRPGFFPTQWNRDNFITKEREEAILNHTPMRRYGNPSELLGAVHYLASNASSFVTGSEIVVDGGFSSMTI